jgi:hypothetical protein
MACERQEDLLDLFRHNGAVYNGSGQPVLRGRVMCIFDRGIFIGHFSTFSVKENDEKAFSFELDWEFKIEQTVYLFPSSAFERPTSASGVDVNGVITPDRQAVTAQDLVPPNVGPNTPQPGAAPPAAEEELSPFQNIIINNNVAVPDEE